MKKLFIFMALMTTGISAFATDSHAVCPTIGGITCEQQVVNSYEYARPITKVTAISDGLYQLEDGRWYSPEYVHPLLTEFKGIKVGQQIVNSYEYARPITKVTAISDGLYQLENGKWYSPEYVKVIDCN